MLLSSRMLVEKISAIITQKRLIPSTVARRAGLAPQEFEDMLSGRRAIRSQDIPKITVALGVMPNELFDKSH